VISQIKGLEEYFYKFFQYLGGIQWWWKYKHE